MDKSCIEESLKRGNLVISLEKNFIGFRNIKLTFLCLGFLVVVFLIHILRLYILRYTVTLITNYIFWLCWWSSFSSRCCLKHAKLFVWKHNFTDLTNGYHQNFWLHSTKVYVYDLCLTTYTKSFSCTFNVIKVKMLRVLNDWRYLASL